MSRILIAATLATLAAICFASSVPTYESLSNPVLVALEETFEDAANRIQTQPLNYVHTESEFGNKLQVYDHYFFVKRWQMAKETFRKLWWLKTEQLSKLRALVVEDVLTNMKDKVHASTKEETRRVILEACQALNTEATSTLAEANAIVEYKPLEEFVKQDDNLLRAFNLASLCKFI